MRPDKKLPRFCSENYGKKFSEKCVAALFFCVKTCTSLMVKGTQTKLH